MADLSHLSLEQLEGMAKQRGISLEKKPPAAAPVTVASLSKMSQKQLLDLAAERGISLQAPAVKEKGFVESAKDAAIQGVVKVGQAVDSVTGAPTRAAIDSLQKGEGLLGSVKRFGGQFANDPSKAPTGKDIALNAGASNKQFKVDIPGTDYKFEASPADLLGVGVDLTADPTNFIPGSSVIKGVGKGAKSVGRVALKAADVAIAPLKETSVVNAISNTAKGTKYAFDKLFNPKIADDFSDLSSIAQKNGIDPSSLPESIEFGDTSVISRAARQRREGLLGQQSFDQFEDGLTQVRDAADRKISEISRGPVLNPVEAGNYIRDSFDQAYDEFFSKIDTSYNKIIKDYPGLTIADSAGAKLETALDGIEKFAKGRVARGVTQLQEAQGQRLLNSVAAIRNTNGSVKQAVEALRDIGEASFKSQNTLAAIPADVQRMRKLYGDITEAIHETIQTNVQNGHEISGALRINNNLMSEFFGDKSVLEKTIGNRNVAPENVFNSLVLSGDTRKIEALKNILGPERMQQIKGAALNSLIKRTDDLDFNFKQVRNAIRNKKSVLSELLDEGEALDFSELVKLGDRFGTPVLSTSGTGASNVFKDLGNNLQNAVFNESFVEGLKKRARAGINLPVQTAPLPSITAAPSSPLARTASDNAAKGLQAIGTVGNEEEKRRQETYRRRLQKGN